MPVTEIALLHIRSGEPLHPSSELAAKLCNAQKAQSTFSQHPVYFFTQVEDPSYIYLLSTWNSVAQHMEEWIPSTTNQEFMQSLKDELEVEWMFHVGIDIDRETALPGTNAEPQRRQEDSVFNAPTIAIGRYFITPGKRDEFTKLFAATNIHLAKFVSPRPFLGAWRLDKGVTTVDDLKASPAGSEERKEEFVLFTGWDNVTHHLRFAQSDGFHEFQRIRDSVDGAEIKHVVRLSL